MTNNEILEARKKYLVPTAYHYCKTPVQLTKAQGCYVWDEKGERYLDAIGGIVSIAAGHNHPKIKKKLLQMLDQDEIQHTSLLYLSHYPVELAKALVDECPPGVDKVALTNSGSEANEVAFMAARHATGETTIVNLRHSYHGGTSAALASCGHNTWRFRGQPVTAVTSAMEPYCYRCPFNKTPDTCHLECAKNVETTIQTTTHGKIAAFIAEPVMGVGGFITPPDEYFKLVTKIVHNYGGYYISDEVQTGAGRCGDTFLLTKSIGIDADMVTMAKGLGNGAAIGAAVMKSAIAEKMTGKLYFNTFGGDPYQTAQAKINMDVIREEKLIENSQAMGKRLRAGLEDLMKTHPHIGEVRGRGLLLGFELVKDRKTKAYASEETADLMEICKDNKLLIGKGGLYGNVVRIAPPLSINASEIDEMLKILDAGLTQVEKKHGKPSH